LKIEGESEVRKTGFSHKAAAGMEGRSKKRKIA
jgi:hypothetical protein